MTEPPGEATEASSGAWSGASSGAWTGGPTWESTGTTPAGVGSACAFHPDRPTRLQCTRCGRPACPECLTPASVGFHCRACVAESRASQRTVRTVAGGRLDRGPVVTYAMIAVNVAIFLITAIQAKSGNDLLPSSMYLNGGLAPELVASGQWWRLLTSGFLHASVIHIGLNMLSLYLIGRILEQLLGRWQYLAVYLLSLIGGSAAVMLFSEPLSLSVGASGAIFGLMGGLVVAFRRFRYDLRQLLVVLGINLFISFRVSGISWQAHLGGLAVGALVTAAIVYAPRSAAARWLAAAAGGVLVLVLAAVLVRNGQIGDHGCVLTANGFFECLYPG